MKTLSAFVKNCGHINENLIRATVKQFGGWEQFKESAENVTNHGISGGYGGFTWYSDTVPFAENRANRKLIIKMLEQQAQDFGQEVVEMVGGFGVFRHNKMDETDRRDLYRYLSETKCKETTIPNLMAWYAGEEVCRAYVDCLERA